MTLSFRLATLQDLPRIHETVEAAYGGYVQQLGQRPAPMDEDYRSRIQNGQVTVAVSQETVVGLLVLVSEVKALLLDNIALHPDAQGQGFGRALMQFVEDQAREAGKPVVRLYTHQQMKKNIVIYKSLGYHETHRNVVNGFPRVFMEKPLR